MKTARTCIISIFAICLAISIIIGVFYALHANDEIMPAGLLGRLRGAYHTESTHRADTSTQNINIKIAGLKVSVWRPKQPHQGRVPLIIFSHGFHGSSTQSTFLTQALAEEGYLVMAPNHQDSLKDGLYKVFILPEVAFSHPDKWNDSTYRDRANDINRLITALENDRQWSARIDWTKIALIGHSLGGYTALGLAGAWPRWRQPYIRAVIALSPYVAPFITNHTLGGLEIPVMYQGGTADSWLTTPWVRRTGGAYDQTPSPAYYIEFRGAGHFAWTDLTAEHHQAIRYCCLWFLSKYLKNPQSNDIERRFPDVSDLRSK